MVSTTGFGILRQESRVKRLRAAWVRERLTFVLTHSLARTTLYNKIAVQLVVRGTSSPTPSSRPQKQKFKTAVKTYNMIDMHWSGPCQQEGNITSIHETRLSRLYLLLSTVSTVCSVLFIHKGNTSDARAICHLSVRPALMFEVN